MGNLVADRNVPGLWHNLDWREGTPGTFVMLIGVSAYDYLIGGAGRPLTKTNYGLQQLSVSALTTHALFQWFQENYLYSPSGEPACPVAKCWLLLSPTEAEKSFIDQEILSHSVKPTFSQCREAISYWHNAMESLPKAIAEKSRAFFFFSGHGLEVHQDEQIVLPCDWLKPITGGPNDALNIRKLSKGLSRLSVAEQYFFIDACRSDHPQLRSLEIQGDGVITTGQSYLTNPACNGPILYASASGTQTYQPTDPGNGNNFSLFGQALLDGLKAQEGFLPDCGETPCAIKFAPLHGYLGKRYNQLLKKHNATFKQYILQAGQCSDPYATISHVKQPVMVAPSPEEVSVPKEQEFTTSYNIKMFPPTISGGGGPFSQIQEHPFSFSLHGSLGRKQVNDMWENARLYSFETKKWMLRRALSIRKVERTRGNHTYQLTITIPNSKGSYWLEVDYNEDTYAFVLPGERLPKDLVGRGKRERKVSYLVEFTIEDAYPVPSVTDPFRWLKSEGTEDEPDNYGRYQIYQQELYEFYSGERYKNVPSRIVHFTVGLAFNNGGHLGEVTQIWEKYRTVNAAKAAEEIDLKNLQHIVIAKAESPLGAIIASLIILRAGRLDLIEETWLRNIMNWFPQRPDSPILYNEFILSKLKEGNLPMDVVECLLEMNRRGLPYTAEALGYAARQIEDVLDFSGITENLHDQLQKVQTRIRRALRYLHPGGLFTVYSGSKGDLSPQLIEGMQ